MMKRVVQAIRGKYSKCISESCKGRKCNLPIGSINKDCLAILDMERYKTNYTGNDTEFCDFLIFYADVWAVCAAELKGGGIKANKASAQIQAGAQLAERLMSTCLARRFYPLLLRNRGKRLDNLDYRLLQHTRILFQKIKYPIRILPSGTSLEEILRTSG